MSRNIILAFIFSVLLLNNILGQDLSEVQSIINSDSSSYNFFGESIALHNDLLIVGARGSYEINRSEGAAYIFKYDNEGNNKWTQVAKLTASDAKENDFFGSSVDIFNDLAIVGACDYYGTGSNSGSAYIFKLINRETQEWIELAKLSVSDIGRFGTSVAIHKDIAIVGAPLDNDHGENTGATYVFGKSADNDNTWYRITKITNPESSNSEAFGSSIDISDEFIIIGAPNNNSIDIRSGAAFVYQKNAGGTNNWGNIKKLTPLDGKRDHRFGGSVSIFENRILVGASGADGIWPKTGAAYLYGRNNGGENNWGKEFKIIASDGYAGDFFGNSVSLYDETAIIGAYNENEFVAFSGTSYIFKFVNDTDNAWEELSKVYSPNAASGDNFGYSVVTNGEHFVVGAPKEDKSGTNNGGVYIYEKGMFTNTEDLFSYPGSIKLNQNYPNPFNPSTVISYFLPKSSFVELSVYDITGKLVSLLVGEQQSSGEYEITFNASGLSSGVYFYQLKTNDYLSQRKMLLLR